MPELNPPTAMTPPHLYLESTRSLLSKVRSSILPFLLEGKPSILQQKGRNAPESCRRSQDAQSAVWQCSVQLAIIMCCIGSPWLLFVMCCIGSPWLLFVATSVVVARSRRLTAYVLCDLSNRVRSESLRKIISRNSWKR